MNIESYEQWFAGYTTEVRSCISGASVTDGTPFTKWGWNISDKPSVLDEVDLKIEHTYNVKNRCKEIALWLNLSSRDVLLAEIIGLFHDLGRFRQSLQFGTMDDRITGSHGEMSADTFLCDTPKYDLTDEEIVIIADALRYHNVFKLPQALTGRPLLFARIARDGDKLDILRFYSDKQETRGFRFIMSEEPGEYSKKLVEGALRGENLQIGDIKNRNDRKLVQMSLVYDINFGYSFRWILKKDYLAAIAGEADEVIKKVCDYATDWMKERIDKTK